MILTTRCRGLPTCARSPPGLQPAHHAAITVPDGVMPPGVAVTVSVSRSRTLSDHSSVGNCPEPVITIECSAMADLTEIEALRASVRGARSAAAALERVATRLD